MSKGSVNISYVVSVDAEGFLGFSSLITSSSAELGGSYNVSSGLIDIFSYSSVEGSNSF